MTREEACAKIDEVIENLDFEGTYVRHEIYGSGHINDTFAVYMENGTKMVRYILQRMNTDIFKNPVELMENIVNITSYLRDMIIEDGGNPNRETLNVVKTKKGGFYYIDSLGNYWRAYIFIENSTSYDAVERSEDFYESAVAFGNFQKLLADFPAETLHETIANFHNTAVRVKNLKKAVAEDKMGRAKEAEAEIKFVMDREREASTCVDMQANGELPLKVTHNDTKLNNIMIDNKTGKALCIIDLDTVMPGLVINDFGDSIRFGASTGAEDEPDLSKVSMSLDLYEIYVKGFLEGCAGRLTEIEIDMLPMGAKLMTYECGVRFLTDYLEGDTYFKIHREGQNLDRSRTQFKLVADMENKWETMKEIIEKYR